jgi:hypothetical protein
MPDLILVVVDVVVVFGSCSWGKVNGTKKSESLCSSYISYFFSISISYIIITEAEEKKKKKVKRNSIHINRTKNRRMKKVFLRVRRVLNEEGSDIFFCLRHLLGVSEFFGKLELGDMFESFVMLEMYKRREEKKKMKKKRRV